MVLGVCMKYLQNEPMAKDTAMEVFELLIVKLKQHEVHNFKYWLYSLTKNQCLMKLRSNKKSPGTLIEELVTETPEAISGSEIKWMQEKKYLELEQQLDLLKPEQKECVSLFYLKNKSYQEIADALQMEVKKVKSHIQNGKRNLKLNLERSETFSK